MRGKKRAFSIKKKLEVVDFSKKNSVFCTARTFSIDPKQVMEWKKQEEELRRARDNGQGQRQKLSGGGRKLSNPDMETSIIQWIRKEREAGRRVSRRMIVAYGRSIVGDNSNFAFSNGWMEGFLKRNNLVTRRCTTTSQSLPSQHTEKLVEFVLYIGSLIRTKLFLPHDI